jgi:putative ABC transport system permease protein
MMHRPVARSVRISLRVYAALLRAYPPAFRGAFGSAMQATLRDAASDAHDAAGTAGMVRLWLRTIVDLLRSVPREWFDRTAPTGRSRGIPYAGNPAVTPRRSTRMSSLAQDVRYAVRSLRRAPAFTAIAVATLGIGIGAVVALFSIVDGVLLRPLPYEQPDGIVRIVGASRTDPEELGNVSPMDVVDWREQATSFDAITMGSGGFVAFTGSGEPEMVWANRFTADVFPILRVRPERGRFFTQEEQVIGRHHVVVITHGLWQSRFGGDESIIGRSIELQSTSFEIIGVLPADFRDPAPGPFGDAMVWYPLAIDLSPQSRGGHWLQSYARLAPGATVRGAEAEMQGIMDRLAKEYPSTNTDATVRIFTLHDAIAGDVKQPLEILFGAVVFLLLIACVNVANLMLARAATRQREMAVRSALGAGRLRVARQLVIESLVLAFAASAAGVPLAWGVVRAIPVLAGGQLPRADAITINGSVLLFTLGVAVFTAMLFGLAPVVQTLRGDVQSTLRDSGRTATTGVSGRRLRGALISIEVALAAVMLVGAGLLVRSFRELLSVDTGFQTTGIVTATISLPSARYEPEQRAAFFRTLEERADAIPDVRQAGFVDMLPMSNRWSCDSFAVDDREPPPSGQEPCAETRSVSTSYFDAFGITLRAGRAFDDTDRDGSQRVAIIDDMLAQQFWPGQDPIGRRVKWGSYTAGTPWLTIVGVAQDVKHFGLDAEGRPTIYMPMAQHGVSMSTLVAATRGSDTEPALNAIRSLVRELDPELPIVRLETMRQVLDRSVAAPRFRTVLLSAFAAVALLLSLVGLYGVLAFMVAQRTQEFGIRMAIGAARRDVLRLVVRQGLGFVLAGIAVGVPVALLATRALAGVLFGVPTTDAPTFVSVVVLLVAVSMFACWLPAMRATRVDPMIALREE